MDTSRGRMERLKQEGRFCEVGLTDRSGEVDQKDQVARISMRGCNARLNRLIGTEFLR